MYTSNAPSVIIEIAFHDNVADIKRMKNKKNAITDAIAAETCAFVY